jgi:hypothetical protein
MGEAVSPGLFAFTRVGPDGAPGFETCTTELEQSSWGDVEVFGHAQDGDAECGIDAQSVPEPSAGAVGLDVRQRVIGVGRSAQPSDAVVERLTRGSCSRAST